MEADDEEKYVSSAHIRATFGVSNATLRNWAEAGKVRVVRFGAGAKRLYLLSDIHASFSGYVPKTSAGKEAVARERRGVCYARVSSQKQKDDLERQVQDLEAAYPDHEVITDIASGINWKRPGLIAILDRAMRGDVKEVVVAHRDRLCRFAFDLVKHVLDRAGCRIVVLDKDDGAGDDSVESELRDDLLAIVTVFVASNNGKRSAANRRARKKRALEEEEEDGNEEERQEPGNQREERGDHEMLKVANPPDEAAGGDPAALA